MATVVALYERGLTYNQIASKLGVTRGTVGGHLKRWRETLTRPVTSYRVNPQSFDGADDARQRMSDRKFVRALALAFQRGDHLPSKATHP